MIDRYQSTWGHKVTPPSKLGPSFLVRGKLAEAKKAAWMHLIRVRKKERESERGDHGEGEGNP